MTEEQKIESLKFNLETKKQKIAKLEIEIVDLKRKIDGDQRIIRGYSRFIRDNLHNTTQLKEEYINSE